MLLHIHFKGVIWILLFLFISSLDSKESTWIMKTGKRKEMPV